MKIKPLLITFSSITLLLTSCESEYDKSGSGGGGGLNGEAMSVSTISVLRSLDQNVDLGKVNVSIIDAKEEVVYYKTVDPSLEVYPTINETQLPKGIYYIEISSEDGKTIQNDSFTVK